MWKPTAKAARFMEANETSPVISGRVLNDDGGACYTLDNGLSFRLTRDDLAGMKSKSA